MASIEQSGAERQHAAHEVVAHAVERVALWVAERLHSPAHRNEQQGVDVALAPKQQAVDYIELHHQSEEPVGAGPYHMVGVGHHVVEHEHLSEYVHDVILVRSGRDGVNHRERHEAHYHHLEQLNVVMLQERYHVGLLRRERAALLVLHDESVGGEEEEHRHTVMAEERHEMDGQVEIGVCERLHQIACLRHGEGVLVFLYGETEPVTVVVQEDAYYGESAHGGTFCAGKHYLFFNSKFVVIRSFL